MKKLKPFDYIIIIAVIAVVLIGALAYLGKNKFSKSPVEATKKIAFQVMIRSVSLTDAKNPFKIGEESFITIRNVPYTKLQIIDVASSPKKTILPVNNPQQPFIVIDDYSQPFQFDFVVTLIDDAKITKDGPVVGGNKIKIGLPIVLEGFNYRIGGSISNVQVLEDKDVEMINKYVATAKKQQLVEMLQENADAQSDQTANEDKKQNTKEEKTQKSAE